MSFQAMAWAVAQKLPTRDKFVLLMLANYASNETGDCYPSLLRLADDTSLSRNSVIQAIKTLEELGALRVIRRTQDGVNLPNVYRLNLAWGGSAATAPLVQPLVGGSAATAPESINQPINNKKEKRERVKSELTASGALVLTVDQELQADWTTAFPALNVANQIERAALWLNANPANRKSNYERFLLNWLTRAQDQAPRLATASAQPMISGGRRPVHPSWYASTTTTPTQEQGNVFDVMATEVAG